MLKYMTICWLIFLVPLQLIAQAPEKKSSKYKRSIDQRKLRMDKSVPVLLDEAEKLMEKNVKKALDKVEEALAQSISQESSFNEASCYVLLGRINQEIEQWDLALDSYDKAFKLLETSYRTTPQYTETLNGLSTIQNRMGRYNDAIQTLSMKLEVTDKPEEIVITHLDMADTYYDWEKLTEANQSVNTADSLINRSGLRYLKRRSQAIKTKILARQGEIEKAEDLYLQNQLEDLTDSVILADDESIETSKEELLNAYKEQGRIEEEIDLRNQSIDFNKNRRRPLKVVKEKQELGKRFVEIDNTPAAIRELEEAAFLADSLSNNKELASAYRSLAETWDKTGNTEQSLKYYRLYSTYTDSLAAQQALEEEQKDLILRKQLSINSLPVDFALDASQYNLEQSNIALQDNQLQLQRFVIYGLIAILVTTIIGSWFIFRNAKRSNTRGQLLALKSLRGQMNPHFIFNALNSVNQFIALSDERAANKYIAEFSKLMRLILDHSQLDFITLNEEKDILALYLKLEHNRFRDKFDYEFEIDEDLALESTLIPPMLIQPYIENAIWHGLRYKEEKGHLNVSLQSVAGALEVNIIDDGIGRTRSRELKTKHQKVHQSTGLKNTKERIKIINKIYDKHYEIIISDLHEDGTGTHVKLILP